MNERATKAAWWCLFAGLTGLALAGCNLIIYFPEQPQYPLNIILNGAGTGVVTSLPDGVNCSMACTTNYDNGTSVTLMATPIGNSAFVEWGGACGGTGPCSLQMTAAASVTATFVQTHKLVVIVDGSGGGSVKSTPAGIDCPPSCEAPYVSGTSVTLTATPVQCDAFASWSGGGCSTKESSCAIPLLESTSVRATFGPPLIRNGNFDCGVDSKLDYWAKTIVVQGVDDDRAAGSNVAKVGDETSAGNNYISQSFTVPADGGVLKFWYKIVCPNADSGDYAVVSLSDETGVETALLRQACDGDGAWRSVSVDLAGSAGHKVTLGLSSFTNNAPPYTYVLYDDVEFRPGI